MSESPTVVAAAPGSSASTADPSFLDRLSAAAELVAAQRFREAEDEVLRGLSIAPADIRALKLLALVRFKLGRFEDARGVCRQIAAVLPRDAGIRLKLGLIALKLDQLDESVHELETCTQLAPDDVRAWSYLGFAYARRDERARAAAAFRRAGQEVHAQRAEQGAVMVPDVDEGAIGTAETPVVLATSSVSPSGSVRSPAPSLESVFELSGSLRPRIGPSASQRPPLMTAGAGGGAWSTLTPVSPLVAYAVSHLAPATAHATWVGATVRLAVGDGVFVRADAAIACTGEARWQPAERHVRGRSTGTPLGGQETAEEESGQEQQQSARRFFRVTDGRDLFVAAPSGRLVPLRLEDDILYLREDSVLAFEGSVSWEYGQIPRNGLPLLQFRGRGLVAIRVRGEPGAVKVTAGRPLFASAPHLLGWIGRVVVRGVESAAPSVGSEPPPFGLACEGEGVVLMDVAAGSQQQP